MITAKDIAYTLREHPEARKPNSPFFEMLVATASLRIEDVNHINGHYANQQGGGFKERVEKMGKRKIHHKLYGDLRRAVSEAQHKVMDATGIGSDCRAIMEAFDSLHKLIEFDVQIDKPRSIVGKRSKTPIKASASTKEGK